MILENEVEVKIGNINISHYRSKGYNCNIRDIIIVPIKDLYQGSNTIIHARCENTECLVIKPMSYNIYQVNLNSTEIHKYYCNKCNHIKNKMLADIKQQKGELTRDNKYYWKYEINRNKEFIEYIDKYKSLNNIKNNDTSLYHAITKYEKNILEFTKKLNINIDNLFSIKKPNNYFTKEYIISCLWNFINNNNRFPSQNEMISKYNISSSQFNKYFKDYNECKKEINYYNKNDLIDNRGDINRSYFELFVANYLIAQGLGDYYNREEFPFRQFNKMYNYRSDFVFYPNNLDKEIHIEVWGYKEGNENYLKVKKIKENLYNKYSDKLILIPIDITLLQGNIKTVENNLYNIFKDYFNLEYKNINYELLFSASSMSEEDIFNLLISYSNNNDKLPTGKEIQMHKGGHGLLKYINKRYGGLTYFANKYNFDISHKNNYWDDQKVFECFDYTIEIYKEFYSSTRYRKEKDIKLKGFHSYINGNEMEYKLRYFEYLIINNKTLNNYLLNYLIDISNNTLRFVKTIIPIQQHRAKQLLLQYNNQQQINNNSANNSIKEVSA